MSFYPDGQPRIPNQIPVPGTPSAPTPADAARARSRAFIRMAVINGVVLGVAVLVGFVWQQPSPESGVWVVIGAALLTGLHSVVVVMRLAQGQRATTRQVPLGAERAVADAPVDGVEDAMVHDAVTDRTAGATTGGAFALQVEDVFTITGRGTVVTGRVSHGEVRTGQSATLLREGRAVAHVRVSGIEAFRKRRTTASAGDSVGLLLSGVTRDEVARGDVLTA